MGSSLFLFERYIKNAAKQNAAKLTASISVIFLSLSLAGCSGGGGGGNVVNAQNTAPTFSGLALVIVNDSTTVTAAWLDAQDDTTLSAQIKYNVYVSKVPNFIPSVATLNQTVTGQNKTTITGLLADTSYYIQVVAIDSEGMSSISTNPPVSAITFSSFVFSQTTPLSKAADLHLTLPTVIGSIYHYPFTGVEQLPPIGSILIGEDANGDGYLVKVTSAAITGGEVVVQTAQGTLSEAVELGAINTTSTLFETPSTPVPLGGIMTGLITAPYESNPTTINKLVWPNKLLTYEDSTATNLPAGLAIKKNLKNGHYLITDTNNTSGTLTRLGKVMTGVVTGEASEVISYDIGVAFTPQISTDLKWSTGLAGLTLEKGQLLASGTLTLDANALYNFDGSGTYTKDVTFDVFKRTYTSVYVVGTVPVYQKITFTLGAHLEANATAAIKASANSKISQTVTFGVKYNPATSAWEPVAPTSTNNNSLTANLNAKGGVTSEIRLIPNIEVKYYSSVSANLSLEPVVSGNIQSELVANADYLAGSFPPGIIQLTAFDAALNAQCFVGANLQLWLSPEIPLLSKTQVCDIPVYTFFSLPTLVLSSQAQADGTELVTANVTDGDNDPFDDASIKWTIYPSNAGTISPVEGEPRQASFAFNPDISSATIFFSGYGKLGELGRQFAQTDVQVQGHLNIASLPTSLAAGSSTQLTVTAADQLDNPVSLPSGLQWTSSDLSVATVDSTGLLTAIGAGTADITVSKAGWLSGKATAVVDSCFAKGYVCQGGLIWTPNNMPDLWAAYPGLPHGAEAASWCASTIFFDGYAGWRLPTQTELTGLYTSGVLSGQGYAKSYDGPLVYTKDWDLNWTWTSTAAPENSHYGVDLSSGVSAYNPGDAGTNLVTCVKKISL